jgi:DNA-binding CsgD family transcriptional regulator
VVVRDPATTAHPSPVSARAKEVPERLLAGRDDELRLIHTLVSDLADGRSGLLTLSGPPGCGRSGLVREAVAHAKEAGLTAGLVACSPIEKDIPYSTVSQLVAILCAPDRLHAISPAWTTDTASSGPIPVLCNEFLGLAEQRPLLLAVDDNQWSDPWSQRWLRALTRRADRAPILVVRTIRAGTDPEPDPTGRVMGWGRHDEGFPVPAHEVELAPLGADDVTALLDRARPGAVEPEFAEAAVRATGGNPAVVREVLGGFAGSGLPFGAPQVPELLEAAENAKARLAARGMRGLPADAVRLLRSMTVCGEEFDFELACALAGLHGAAADGALDVLVRVGLVTGRDEPRFAGTAVATAVRDEMDAVERESLHARAAELGHRAAIGAGELAELLLAAPPLERSWVVEVLGEAAERRRLAAQYEQAASLVRRALREPMPPDERRRLDIELAALEVGQYPAASDNRLRQVLSEAGRDGSPALVTRTADLLLCRGDAESARRAVAEICAGHDEDQEPGHRALCAVGWLAEEYCGTEPEIPVAPLAPLPAEPADLAQAGVRAWQLTRLGSEPERARALARAAQSARGDDAPLAARLSSCCALLYGDELGEAVSGLSAVVAEARRRGARAAAAQALVERAIVATCFEHWDEADDELAAARVELPLRCWHPAMLPRYQAAEIVLNLRRGRRDRAEELAAAELPLGAERGVTWSFLLCAKGELRLADGDPATALGYFEECGRILRAKGWLNPVVLSWRLPAAVAHAQLGNPDTATELRDRALGLAQDWGIAEIFRPVRDAAMTRLAAAGVPSPDENRAAAARTGERSELAPSERQVAVLAARGLSNRDIADALGVAVRTIELRLARSYRKLGIGGRAELPAALGRYGARS